MQKILVFLVIIIIIPVNIQSISAHEQADNLLVFSSMKEGKWTNVTINNNYYMISSDEAFYNDLNISILANPWEEINSKLDEYSFFSENINDTDPAHVINVTINDVTHTQMIAKDRNSPLSEYFDILIDRLLGMRKYSVWPADMAVTVLESYPVKYSVQVFVQRGYDMLTYVYSSNLTLFVSDYDPTVTMTGNGTGLWLDVYLVEIASGGQSRIITFDLVELNDSYAIENLYFTVMLDEGIFLYEYGWNLPVVGDNSLNLDSPIEIPTYANPAYAYFALTLLLVPLIPYFRKK